MAMATVGGLSNGGCRRLALTDEDKAGRDLFVSWCRDAGCRVEWDEVGNIFAIRPGAEPELPIVLTGSHLDTQPNGGRFDGILGVLAGLEAVRACNDSGLVTRRSIAVADWANEEGPRFRVGLTGSRAFVGALSRAEIKALPSLEGPSYGEELARIGYAGSFDLGPDRIASYLELHIEQGPVLERMNRPIGIVESVQGVRWYEVTVSGSDRHAGATPHEMRADSLMTAARFAAAARARCLALDPAVRFTVGQLCVEPGSVNTVPGRAVFTIDLRHPDGALLDRIEVELSALLAEIDGEERTQSVSRITSRIDPVHFNRGLVATLCELAGSGALVMASGAVHDACALAAVVPAAMIFVPSRSGISHSHEEWTEPAQAAAGCALLARALLHLAEVPGVPRRP